MLEQTTWAETGAIFVVTLYNFAILCGVTYLVLVHQWSMWTYLLGLCFITTVKTGKAAEKNERSK